MIKELPLTPEGRTHVAAWIKALLSGKYTQGVGKLKTPSGAMCCMGVSCNVIDPTGWRPMPTRAYQPGFLWPGQKPEPINDWWGRGLQVNYPPEQWSEMLFGVENRLTTSGGLGTFRATLSQMNDGQGATFADVAAVLQLLLDEKEYTYRAWCSLAGTKGTKPLNLTEASTYEYPVF